MQKLEQSEMEKLAGLPVPTLSATLYAMGYTNCFLAGLSPVDLQSAHFVGTAYTMRALPARPDILAGVTSGALPNMHRQGLAQAGPGDVIVTDCGGDNRISFFGELITTHLRVKGISAIVTDAGMADVIDVAATRLPVFCQGSAPVPAPARQIICDLQCPIACMGVTIYPGDILVGDENGVVAIPRAIVTDVIAGSTQKEHLERFLLSRLKQGAPLDGTYPPNAEMLAEYEASKTDDK